MKLVLLSKLNFRNTRESIPLLAGNAEYIFEDVLRQVIPGVRFKIVNPEAEIHSFVDAIPVYDCDNDERIIEKDHIEYQINGVVGILKIDLPSRDLYSSDITNRIRDVMRINKIEYIDIRID